MARHHDRLIREAQAAAAPNPADSRWRTTQMTHDEIVRFLAGFGLSGAATKRIRDRWMADRTRAYRDGYDEGADSVRGDPDFT